MRLSRQMHDLLGDPTVRVLVDAILETRKRFQEAGLEEPTVMVVEDDVKERLRKLGVEPDADGIFCRLLGVKIR